MLPPTPAVKPNKWSCEITAYAMATNTSVGELIKLIGHDGSKIVWDSLKEPMRRRGFHHQELIMAAIKLGFSVTPFELIPAIQPTTLSEYDHAKFLAVDTPERRQMFLDLVGCRRGVITGRCRVSHHAVAFYKGLVLDPDGAVFPFSFEACEARGFFASCLWIVDECPHMTSKS